MKVTIIGGRGNMGRRYRLILKALGHQVDIIEKDDDLPHMMKTVHNTDRIIIATPTNLHCSWLEALQPIGVPVLCEKPICRNYLLTRKTVERVRGSYTLSLVNQYAYLDYGEGDTYYHYFNSGNDGIAWDCINIIGLARGEVRVSNDSFIWRCAINGRVLNREMIDSAYHEMLDEWIKDPQDDSDYILKAHRKAEEYEQAKSTDRHPSQIDQH